MALDSQICGIVDSLADFQVKIMEAVNGRFAALRRLANLLEAAGDLTGFIPDISKLIPLSKIDTRIYDELRVNCPFLNLPPVDISAEQFLGELRAQVNAAYGRLLGQINLHPFSIMGKLQDKLDEFQRRINSEALKSSDFLRCLQSACAVIGQSVEQRRARLNNDWLKASEADKVKWNKAAQAAGYDDYASFYTDPNTTAQQVSQVEAALQSEGINVSTSFTSNINRPSTSILATSAIYYKNMIEGQGQLLSGAAQAKSNDIKNVGKGISELIDI